MDTFKFSLLFALLVEMYQVGAQQVLPQSINVNTCGSGSPVVIVSGGANPLVQIGPNALHGVCPSLFNADPKVPKPGKRRVLIMKARLEPIAHFFLTSYGNYPNTLSETATIHLTLLNVSSTPILITGALTDFKHATPVRTTVGSWGSYTLAASHAASARILLRPGDVQDVSLDRAVRLRGLATILSALPWMTTAYIFDDNGEGKTRTPVYLADQEMLPEFNQILSGLYGAATRVGVTIFEGDYVPLVKVEIPVAAGVDNFYRAHSRGPAEADNPVRFDHSMFLAEAMLDFRRNGAGRGLAPIETIPIQKEDLTQ